MRATDILGGRRKARTRTSIIITPRAAHRLPLAVTVLTSTTKTHTHLGLLASRDVDPYRDLKAATMVAPAMSSVSLLIRSPLTAQSKRSLSTSTLTVHVTTAETVVMGLARILAQSPNGRLCRIRTR